MFLHLDTALKAEQGFKNKRLNNIFMKILDTKTKFAHLGKPGSIFSMGFARRLDLIEQKVDLRNKTILDMGCGEGVWLREFAKLTQPGSVYGSEYDKEQVEYIQSKLKNATEEERKNDRFLQIPLDNIRNCPGENLDFKSEFFDIVFHNEVLEHVQDDLQTLKECFRVLETNGKLIFFTPNRGWPFETHGMFFRGKYYWGNIPFLPWLPKSIFKKFAPHVRNYSNADIKTLIKESGGRIVYHSHVFSGFDGLVRRFGIFGKVIQKGFHFIEKTPLNFFGISHFVIAEKA
jgi:SAM-dependent methyltransferase